MMNSADMIKLEIALSDLNKTAMGRRMFLSSLPLLLSGCAVQKTSNRYREGDNRGQKTDISVQDEVKMSNEYAPQMSKDYPELKNAKVQNYINELGQKIVAANNLHKNPYQYSFTVVESKAVNAFALPAGRVYVTTPLIAMAETEAELAGVVGHEIGHIKARHTAERMQTAKSEQNKQLLYTIGGALGGALLGAGLGKVICSKKDRECMERVVKYSAGAGAFGGLLIQKYAFMANSQEDEMEADRIGFRTSVTAGFSKDHVGNFYSKLLKMEEQYKKNDKSVLAGFADAMSTHPPSKKRVAQMNQMASQTPKKSNAIVSSKDFDAIKKLV